MHIRHLSSLLLSTAAVLHGAAHDAPELAEDHEAAYAQAVAYHQPARDAYRSNRHVNLDNNVRSLKCLATEAVTKQFMPTPEAWQHYQDVERPAVVAASIVIQIKRSIGAALRRTFRKHGIKLSVAQQAVATAIRERKAKLDGVHVALMENYLSIARAYYLWRPINDVTRYFALTTYANSDPQTGFSVAEAIKTSIIVSPTVLSHGYINNLNGIEDAQHSTQLDLRFNRLFAAPLERLSRLTHCTKIYLRDNRLTAVPEELLKLPNLEKLGLDRNMLTELPAAVATLPRLIQLDISYNRLESLPLEQLKHARPAPLPTLIIFAFENPFPIGYKQAVAGTLHRDEHRIVLSL
jgi:Leucine-rich repeat (LRR) protein